MSILPKGRSFTANSGTTAAVLLKGRSSTANSGTQAAVLLGMLLSAPHSLFSIWTDLKRSEKIPGAPTWRWGERIWLTGPSGLHRNSPQGLNIGSIRVFDLIRDPEIPINLRPPPPSRYKITNYFSEEYKACSSALHNFLHPHVLSSLLPPNIFLSTLFWNTTCASLSKWEIKFHNHTIQPVI